MPFDIKGAALFGKLSQQFPNKKSSVDQMIAAHAMALDVVLVTNNVADLSSTDCAWRTGLSADGQPMSAANQFYSLAA